MPPRKKNTTGPPALTDADVAALRSRVNAGEKPRVLVRAASAAVPAGTRGNVIRIGNPSEGEFIVVRLGRDEVPFAPGELAMSGRGAAAATATTARAAGAAAHRRPTATKPASGGRRSATTAPARTTARPSGRSATASAGAASPATTGNAARTAGKPAPKAVSGRTRPVRGSRRAPQPLTVTLRFTDGAWTVEASRGARRLARPTALRPGAVKAFADLVDEAQVREALTETVESCRAVVEQRAAALRAELEAAEDALREYEARRR